jgi:hypothetical protein
VFEVEIDWFAPDHRHLQQAGLTPEGVAEAVREPAAAAAACVQVVNIDVRQQGDLICWLAGDRARLRLDLHREWFASDSGLSPDATNEVVSFRDNDGSEFVESHGDTISRGRALEAFWHWVRTGQMDPGLTWA